MAQQVWMAAAFTPGMQDVIRKKAEMSGMDLRFTPIQSDKDLVKRISNARDEVVLLLSQAFDGVLWTPESVKKLHLLNRGLNLRVIFFISIPRSECDNQLISSFIENGTYDFLFAEEKRADKIVALVKQGRTREEAYKYADIEMPAEVVRRPYLPPAETENETRKKKVKNLKKFVFEEPVEYVRKDNARRIIGVISSAREDGATLLSYNLALHLSGKTRVAYFELPPNNKTLVYNCIGDRFPVFIPHAEQIAAGSIPMNANICDNVEYYCERKDGTVLSPEIVNEDFIRKYIGLTSATSIVDIGSEIQASIENGLVELLTDAIIVIRYDELRNRVERVEKLLTICKNAGICPIIVLIGLAEDVPCFKYYKTIFLNVSETRRGRYVGNNNELEAICSSLGLSTADFERRGNTVATFIDNATQEAAAVVLSAEPVSPASAQTGSASDKNKRVVSTVDEQLPEFGRDSAYVPAGVDQFIEDADEFLDFGSPVEIKPEIKTEVVTAPADNKSEVKEVVKEVIKEVVKEVPVPTGVDEKEYLSLKEQLNQATITKKNLGNAISELNKQLVLAQKDGKEKDKRLSESAAECRRLSDEIGSLRNELSQLRKQSEELNERAQKAEQDLSAAQKDSSAVSDQLARKIADADARSEALKKCEAEVEAKLEEAVNERNRIVSEAEKTLKEVMDEKARVTAEAEKTRRELIEERAKIKEEAEQSRLNALKERTSLLDEVQKSRMEAAVEREKVAKAEAELKKREEDLNRYSAKQEREKEKIAALRSKREARERKEQQKADEKEQLTRLKMERVYGSKKEGAAKNGKTALICFVLMVVLFLAITVVATIYIKDTINKKRAAEERIASITLEVLVPTRDIQEGEEVTMKDFRIETILSDARIEYIGEIDRAVMAVDVKEGTPITKEMLR